MVGDLKPEAVSEKNALPCCKYTNLYQTLPVEIILSGHLMSPVFLQEAEKDPMNSKIRLVFENCSLPAVTSDVKDCSSKKNFQFLDNSFTVGCRRVISVHCPAATISRAE